MNKWVFGLAAVAAAGCGYAAVQSREYKSGVKWAEPAVVAPADKPGGPPADATVLLGDDMAAWESGDKWPVEAGVATAKGAAVRTKQAFGDCQLHVEFATPAQVKGTGQGRGNNGVQFGGAYEVQILDSYDNKTYFDGQCASLYKQFPPLVNACRKPGEWQTYDIIYRAPRFGPDKKLTSPAAFTVIHNGIVVQNHAELAGGTFYDRPPSYTAHPEKTPIALYYHGDPVRFRNIWVRELTPIAPLKAE